MTPRGASWLAVKHGLLLAFTGCVGLVAANDRRSNCWLYAIQRIADHGGYIVLRMTTHPGGWWTHASYSKDLRELEEANPTWPKSSWHWWWPPLLFPCRVQRVTRAASTRLSTPRS